MFSGLNLYQSTIFYALSHANLARLAAPPMQCASLSQRVVIGVSTTAQVLPGLIAISKLLQLATERIPDGKKKTKQISLLDSALCALGEEIFFRGILQTGIYYTQTVARKMAPDLMGSIGLFQYACSPSARILFSSALFAGVHLLNGGDYLSQKGALMQAILVFLFPVNSILYEATGGMVAPMAAHLTNNISVSLIVWGLSTFR